MGELSKGKRYYVSGYVENESTDDHFRPTQMTKIGVATERHLYDDSETFDVPNGHFYVDVYPDMDTALEKALKSGSLSTLVVDDNVPDEAKARMSEYINQHPELMEYHYTGKSSSYYNQRNAYIRHHEMESMCKVNGLSVDFDLAESTKLSRQYEDLYAKRDCMPREEIFDRQAAYQKGMGVRFSSQIIGDVTDAFVSDEEAERRADSYYKDVASIYHADYVSVNDVALGEVQKAADGSSFATVTYHDKDYTVTFDDDSSASYLRQAADSVLLQTKENEIAEFAKADREEQVEAAQDTAEIVVVAEVSQPVHREEIDVPSSPDTGAADGPAL